MRDTYEMKWQAKRWETSFNPDEHEEINTYVMGEDLSGIVDYEKLLDINIFDKYIN